VIPTILIVRPFLLLTGEGVANHRDGGRDPTELVSTVQPANTARPVETTKTIIPQPVMGGVVVYIRAPRMPSAEGVECQ
jgi:hypothetical protein